MRIKSSSIVIALATVFLFSIGCTTGTINRHRMAVYRPKVGNRSLSHWQQDVPTNYRRQDQLSMSNDRPAEPIRYRRLKRGDKTAIFLRGIPISEDISEVVDDLGCVNLPLIGTVKLEGKTTSEAERLIENKYIHGGIYKSINVIIMSQPDKFFMQGEIKGPQKYGLVGDLTLLQAIAAAGGYTPYANPKKIQILRHNKKLYFNAVKIEDGKERDPLIRPEDIIFVPRKLW